MNRDWRDIEAAAALLGLGEAATWSEIRRAYRRLSKECHPDVVATPDDAEAAMRRLNAAYGVIREHCETYRFPLKRPEGGEADPYDPQEWWRARFGPEPAWGGETSRKR